eukprot:gb/GECG01000417.1/.p1 GENE.gb/GECG01000417.1/~~gb/GECG01000417.1/.p1  ORF type:complete len:385 (+),score=51.86 gb/GECG01000417.1/:1-1155(+)
MSRRGSDGSTVSFKVYDVPFYLGDKYDLIKPLGRGAFGVVCSAKRVDTGQKYAIKKIKPMAESIIDGKHTLREIRLMRHLGKHENVVSLKDLIVREHDDELYVIMELLDTDLHRIISSSQALGDAHFKHFMFQLLRGLRFTHRAGVIHRDLKPANLLVTKNCDLRISDFGLSRLLPEEHATTKAMTEHVVTRWYRPPELMLNADGNYDESIDIWSCGCIFAEMLGRKTLFPGKDFMHQLKLIFEVIGTPPKEELEYVRSEQAIKFMESLSHKQKMPWNEVYPDANAKALDLLDKMLAFHPTNRISIEDALAHPYFDSVRSQYSLEEPELPPEFEFSFEYKKELNVEDYRQLIIAEAKSFKQERLNEANERRARRRSSGSGGHSH